MKSVVSFVVCAVIAFVLVSLLSGCSRDSGGGGGGNNSGGGGGYQISPHQMKVFEESVRHNERNRIQRDDFREATGR